MGRRRSGVVAACLVPATTTTAIFSPPDNQKSPTTLFAHENSLMKPVGGCRCKGLALTSSSARERPVRIVRVSPHELKTLASADKEYPGRGIALLLTLSRDDIPACRVFDRGFSHARCPGWAKTTGQTKLELKSSTDGAHDDDNGDDGATADGSSEHEEARAAPTCCSIYLQAKIIAHGTSAVYVLHIVHNRT